MLYLNSSDWWVLCGMKIFIALSVAGLVSGVIITIATLVVDHHEKSKFDARQENTKKYKKETEGQWWI